MMLKSQVRTMNHVNGRGLLLAPEGFVAFQLLEGGIVDGDYVDGDFVSHGQVTWTNLTTGQRVLVYVYRLMAGGDAIRSQPSP